MDPNDGNKKSDGNEEIKISIELKTRGVDGQRRREERAAKVAAKRSMSSPAVTDAKQVEKQRKAIMSYAEIIKALRSKSDANYKQISTDNLKKIKAALKSMKPKKANQPNKPFKQHMNTK